MAKWKMPKWMEPYREHIVGNEFGGRNTEELYGGRTLIQVNAPLALIEMGVDAQVKLLYKLKKEGLLK